LKGAFRTVSGRNFAILLATHFWRVLKRPGGAEARFWSFSAKMGVFPGRSRAQAKADPANSSRPQQGFGVKKMNKK